jgi:uncharacterized membrane protein YdjX (TVP38/TMEM64 family)
MTSPDPRALRLRLAALVLVLAVLIALAAAWSWSPMKNWLDVDTIVSATVHLGQRFGLIGAIAAMAVALALAVPHIFLNIVAVVAFGPWMGALCAFPASLLGAAISYGIGAGLGHDVLKRMAGPRINAVSQRLGEKGLLAVVFIRFVPVAPYAIVNMVAGASHIRLWHLLLGSAIGMVPGMVVLMLFVDDIIAALKQPSTLGFGLLALGIVLVLGGGYLLRRWLGQPSSPGADADP